MHCFLSGHGSAEEGRGDTNARVVQEVSKLNEMRKVMILTMFIAVTLLSNLSAVYAAYGLWYTTGSAQCLIPDSSTWARIRVYLLKKGTPLIPYIGYFELICSDGDFEHEPPQPQTVTQTVITTTKPTNWRIVWTFVANGYVACEASASGSGFPAKVPTPVCDPDLYEATVTISAPIH